MGEISKFINFLSRGNLIDIAIGIIIGSAFSNIVKSLVDDLFTPLIDLISYRNMSDGFYVLKPGKNAPYKSRENAKKDGAVIISYGAFFSRCADFVIQGFCIFLVVRFIEKAKKATRA